MSTDRNVNNLSYHLGKKNLKIPNTKSDFRKHGYQKYISLETKWYIYQIFLSSYFFISDITWGDKFEDTKWIIRSHNSRNDR